MEARAPHEVERDFLKDWTTVRSYIEWATFKPVGHMHPAQGRWLLESWFEQGVLEKHDDGFTGVKYRLKRNS